MTNEEREKELIELREYFQEKIKELPEHIYKDIRIGTLQQFEILLYLKKRQDLRGKPSTLLDIMKEINKLGYKVSLRNLRYYWKALQRTEDCYNVSSEIQSSK